MEEMAIVHNQICSRSQKREVFVANELFSDLTKDQQTLFEGIFKYRVFKERSTIYKEGDRDNSLYIVKDGKVSVSFYLEVNTGKIRPIVQTINKNGLLGELEFIDSCLRTSTAIADQDTVLIKIEREAFWELIHNNPELSFIVMKNFNRILVSRFRLSDRQLKIALTMGWNAYRFDKY